MPTIDTSSQTLLQFAVEAGFPLNLARQALSSFSCSSGKPGVEHASEFFDHLSLISAEWEDQRAHDKYERKGYEEEGVDFSDASNGGCQQRTKHLGRRLQLSERAHGLQRQRDGVRAGPSDDAPGEPPPTKRRRLHRTSSQQQPQQKQQQQLRRDHQEQEEQLEDDLTDDHADGMTDDPGSGGCQADEGCDSMEGGTETEGGDGTWEPGTEDASEGCRAAAGRAAGQRQRQEQQCGQRVMREAREAAGGPFTTAAASRRLPPSVPGPLRLAPSPAAAPAASGSGGRRQSGPSAAAQAAGQQQKQKQPLQAAAGGTQQKGIDAYFSKQEGPKSLAELLGPSPPSATRAAAAAAATTAAARGNAPGPAAASGLGPASVARSPQPPWCQPPSAEEARMRVADMAVRRVFGHSGFRPQQREVVMASMAGHDIFVLMPTGGGKSLCFQLPAVLLPGVTVVVCPLLSLMQDQVRALCCPAPRSGRTCGVPASYLSSQQAASESIAVKRELRKASPTCKLLYVTPEQLVQSGALRDILSALQQQGKLARFVIDEAHCVSLWGHEFRKDYKDMGIRRHFPGVPITALTATATSNVREDILKLLGIKRAQVFKTSFHRPNLVFRVVPKVDRSRDGDEEAPCMTSLISFVRAQGPAASGIIYCLSRNEAEGVAEYLREAGRISASHYHAGMTHKQRTEVQNGWQEGRVSVIVATIAFGMGIDKPDVRYVVHYAMSTSMEGYYQEAGRAGRDGLPSQCVLMYAPRDYSRAVQMLRMSGRQKFERGKGRLEAMRLYTQEGGEKCRHAQLLDYFGEQLPGGRCRDACDVCRGEVVPLQPPAKARRKGKENGAGGGGGGEGDEVGRGDAGLDGDWGCADDGDGDGAQYEEAEGADDGLDLEASWEEERRREAERDAGAAQQRWRGGGGSDEWRASDDDGDDDGGGDEDAAPGLNRGAGAAVGFVTARQVAASGTAGGARGKSNSGWQVARRLMPSAAGSGGGGPAAAAAPPSEAGRAFRPPLLPKVGTGAAPQAAVTGGARKGPQGHAHQAGPARPASPAAATVSSGDGGCGAGAGAGSGRPVSIFARRPAGAPGAALSGFASARALLCDQQQQDSGRRGSDSGSGGGVAKAGQGARLMRMAIKRAAFVGEQRQQQQQQQQQKPFQLHIDSESDSF